VDLGEFGSRVPEELIGTLRVEDLPDDWNPSPESDTTRELGTIHDCWRCKKKFPSAGRGRFIENRD
jgi:hypothetical protein